MEDNLFEDIIKQKLENIEVTYDEAVWKGVESKLHPKKPWLNFRNGLIASSIVTLGIVGAILMTNKITTENQKDIQIIQNKNLVNEAVKSGDHNGQNITIEETETLPVVDPPSLPDINSLPNVTCNLPKEEPNVAVSSDNGSSSNNSIDNSVTDKTNTENKNTSNPNENTSGFETPASNESNLITKSDNPKLESPTLDFINSNFTLNTNTICEGEVIIATPANLEYDNYKWVVDGQVFDNKILNFTAQQSGTKNIQLIVNNDRSNSSAQSVTVNETPYARINWTEDKSELVNTFNLSHNNYNGKVIWELDNGTIITNENNINHHFGRAGIHKVKLTTTNNNGCSNTVEETIKVKNYYNLTNQDALDTRREGKFMPASLGKLNLPFSMVVTDRNGKVVHKANSIEQVWRGYDINTGSLCPTQKTYVWKIVLTNEKGQEELYIGEITLI